MAQKSPAHEDLLCFLRRFCHRETGGGVGVARLQRHLGKGEAGNALIGQLIQDGLIEPTFTESDPQDGSTIAVAAVNLVNPLASYNIYTLTEAGYSAVDALLETRSGSEKSELEPLVPGLIEVASIVDIKVLEALARDPEGMFQLTPRQFEEVVAEIFIREGFGVELTPPSKDGGRDILAVKFDALGRHLFIAECKRYAPTHPVQIQYVRALYGVLERERATRAILATTSRFTRGAHAFADDLRWRMSLKDYDSLRKWLQHLFP